MTDLLQAMTVAEQSLRARNKSAPLVSPCCKLVPVLTASLPQCECGKRWRLVELEKER